jgi:histidine ammonia-lyase
VVILTHGPIGIADVVAVARRNEQVEWDENVAHDLDASRAVVDRVLARGLPVYGLNTELGAGRNIVVDAARLEEFQRRTIRNSSGGIGEPLSDEQARAVVFARLVGFTRGGAGVTPALAEQYRALLNRDITPVIPRTGSVGAADLTHLAAVAAAATGVGDVFVNGVRVPAKDAIAPVTLQPHEAIAALSANSYSVGVGALVVADLHELAVLADRVVAISLRAVGGNPSPFDERIQAAHPGEHQAASAARIRGELGPRESTGTQDAISFRSVPQVHGAFGVAVARLADAVERELAASTENPLVDVASDALVSGGNFLVLDLALALDAVRVALAHVAVMSERRQSIVSGRGADRRRAGEMTLPGLLWYSAAAQLAEVRHLANPVSLSGASLSEGIEDHSTNAPLALQLLERSLGLTRSILAIEALASTDLLGEGAIAANDLPLDERIELAVRELS